MKNILLVLVVIFGLLVTWLRGGLAYTFIVDLEQFIGAEGILIRNPNVGIVSDLAQALLIVFFLAIAVIKRTRFYWITYVAVVIACVLFLAFEFWYNNILRSG